ncbi:MAG: aspartate--tRNA ligase, partial [Candidatus Marinimicrobia bacterium]|nr:aspartate--tRNA ligase [Candidatus Neomarinimicrobiota bacterium]
MYRRTHTCGELRLSDLGANVALNGWVSTTRDHGGLIFVDIRDRYGITQLTFNEETHPDIFKIARKLSMEDVISTQGEVRTRKKGAINVAISTGEIEVEVAEMKILNEAKPLPFLVSDRNSATEELRLKYRYLELRTKDLQRFMSIRHKASQSVRNYLSSQNFMEIETPFLMKSTPEGARDYLVPSRIHKGRFYALPQSPQQYKQLLMIAGFDRYFQIVKCFRDEDLRANRQPEFTQIDIEMSFVDETDVLAASEGLVTQVFKEVIDVNLGVPFPTLS